MNIKAFSTRWLLAELRASLEMKV